MISFPKLMNILPKSGLPRKMIAAVLAQSAAWAPLLAADSGDLGRMLGELSPVYARLSPQSIRPAQGYIKYDYLIPAGYYDQMWDWDGFFIGCHLANQSPEQARYLKWWVLDFVGAVDADGYVAGCLTPKGPHPLFGKFAMKPFLAQGALIASERLGDYEWLRSIWPSLCKVASYRERTQFDPSWGLFYWDNSMQSGADNNVALTNAEDDRSAILAVDLCTFQLREYKAMAMMAGKLGKAGEEAEYAKKAEELRLAMLKHLWFARDATFFNVRRSNGEAVRRISYSNFVPLICDILPKDDARAMIRRYLLNPDHMLSHFGLRSLSKSDPDYNNVSMIKPYSNWRGPVWINANYLYFIGLRRYGFDDEASQLAVTLGAMVLSDIGKWGSMHENYNAETGEGLAPTPDQSPGHVFRGFVGWNLLVEDMLQEALNGRGGAIEMGAGGSGGHIP